MLDRIFGHLIRSLEEYLSGYYEHPEGVVKLGAIGNEEGNETEGKMMITLLNMERETAAGRNGNRKEGREYLGSKPPLHLNVYWLLSSAFKEEKYELGLKLLGYSLLYFQQHTAFRLEGNLFTIEPVSLDFQGLANVWSVMGGQYYPSMVYKLRMLTLAGEEISRTAPDIYKTE